MGMNMLTKGSQKVADVLCEKYPSIQLESLLYLRSPHRKPSDLPFYNA